ncbi:riboflavin synthase subunit alpha [Pantoea sp. Aalb]|uniref:riboflavin synthase subunit alpha n=1 Tax=Pantoea sp. Aalb TaxID=2576762 RepID=UPI001329741C|nr:riboflavin synthase subunit alpha [Pantoea sp. Aalb]MXP67421.1 riboflavin synthase subunit alpha [Pantoea sp. Aalb]
MFTGIIQCMAEIIAIKEKKNFRTHVIQLPEELLLNLRLGASVAHNGCCLTVTAIKNNYISFDLMQETLEITNLGELKVGDIVNIERAAKLGDEIGGHLMTGHIITTAQIYKIITLENNYKIWFELSDIEKIKFIFHKSFIGIDGISLTVGNVIENQFCVYLVPETLKRTTIGKKNIGHKVNIEIDLYMQAIVTTVERILSPNE